MERGLSPDLAGALVAGYLETETFQHDEPAQQAFSEASKLPPEQQDALAGWLLREIESETRWGERFSNSEDGLVDPAREALEEHRDGPTDDIGLARI